MGGLKPYVYYGKLTKCSTHMFQFFTVVKLAEEVHSRKLKCKMEDHYSRNLKVQISCEQPTKDTVV